MGVEPFLVASSVSLIEAQRLVRRLCQKCRQPYELSASERERLQLEPTHGMTFYKAAGCRLCHQTGYRGRMGIIEVLLVDEQVRELIVSRVQSWKIKDYAVKELGMTPLYEDGLKKAALGMTTVEEVLSVTTEE